MSQILSIKQISIFGILLFMQLSIFANNSETLSPSEVYIEEVNNYFSNHQYVNNQIKNIDSNLPLYYDGQVERCINYILTKVPFKLEQYIGRSVIAFPMIEKIFQEEGIPKEMKYLAVVESGLNPRAVSKAGAVGMWQFMKPTGQMYDLNANVMFDERRNPEKATRAAARHLKDLYRKYGDWFLAMAAYNSGSGNVDKALRKSANKTFYGIKSFLPRETQMYVPSYIAMRYLFEYNEQWDIQPKPNDIDFHYGYQLWIHEAVEIDKLANDLNYNVETILSMNPELLSVSIDQTMLPYPLRMPKRNPTKKVVVKKQERLNAIYPIEKRGLNNVRGDKYLNPFERLMINKNYNKNAEEIVQVQQHPGSYWVKQNDTRQIINVHSIPLQGQMEVTTNVNAVEFPAYASIKIEPPLAPTRKIESVPVQNISTVKHYTAEIDNTKVEPSVMVKSQKTTKKHMVKRGDTLWSLSALYKCSIEDIKKWNSLSRNLIYLDQELIVYYAASVENHLATQRKSVGLSQYSYSLYEVKPGDTLYSIQKKFGCNQNVFASLNGTNDEIKIGQEMKIPM